MKFLILCAYAIAAAQPLPSALTILPNNLNSSILAQLVSLGIPGGPPQLQVIIVQNGTRYDGFQVEYSYSLLSDGSAHTAMHSVLAGQSGIVPNITLDVLLVDAQLGAKITVTPYILTRMGARSGEARLHLIGRHATLSAVGDKALGRETCGIPEACRTSTRGRRCPVGSALDSA